MRVRTFLFTDLEGSTSNWLRDEDRMAAALRRHDAVLRTAVEGAGGSLLKHTGDGIVAVFDHPERALAAATDAQRALRADPEPDLLRVRMGVHSGRCIERDGDCFGPTLNRAARIMAAAHGGQVVVSAVVAHAVGDRFVLRDLGTHRLRDLLEAEPLHQVVVDDDEYPPLRSLEAVVHDLPVQRTPLIGREHDVTHVLGLVERSRLVTLAGIGGVGKTRLALEVAAHVLDQRSAVFVDLSVVTDGDGVVRAVAAALSLPPGDGGHELETVLRALRSRDVLLVLDNCEHVLDASAEVVEGVLDEAPGVRVLATSREPLGVDAEQVWRVPSLTDPTAALELFTSRAAAASVEIVLDDASEALIVEICAQLDGIPLAIELAAARTSHLSLPEIAGRLQERFRLLTGGRRRARQRHQTLQAALDWSHDLLGPEEQRVLRHAAVFVGGFTLDALADVVGDVPEARLLDLVGLLVDRSLVATTATTTGPTRYRLLETVRLYGLDRLAEAGEAQAARDRHAAWIRRWLGEPEIGWSVFVDDHELRRLDRENVLVALEWVADSEDLEALGRLVPDVLEGLGMVLWVDDGWRYLGRSDVEAALDPDARARYLAAGAFNANALGDFRVQAELATRARALAPTGTRVWRAATGALANAESVFRPDVGRRLYAELLPTIPADEVEELSQAVARSADPDLMVGEVEEGVRRLDEAERIGGRPDMDAGFTHLLLDRRERTREVLALFEDDPMLALLGYRAPLLAGVLAAVEGRLDDARVHLVGAIERIDRMPVRLVDRDVLAGLAALAHHAGRHDRAAALLATAANGPIWARSPGLYAFHVHYRRLVRPHLSGDEVRRIRAEAEGRVVEDVLRAEVQLLRAG